MTPERTAKLSASIAKAFGEGFTFTARKQADDVDLPRVPDPSRPQFEAIGTWNSGGQSRFVRARGATSDDQAQGVVAAAPRADFATDDLAWMPIEGDLCMRIATGETFAVARAPKNGFGRTFVHLTAKKR